MGLGVMVCFPLAILYFMNEIPNGIMIVIGIAFDVRIWQRGGNDDCHT
jgi:hypothetical protein